MKKNNGSGNFLLEKYPFKHFLLMMRTTFILLFVSLFSAMAEPVYTQKAKVTIRQRDVSLKEMLNEIERQTDYLFIYNNEVDTDGKVSVKADQKTVSEVLECLLGEKSMDYTMEGNHIILSVRKNGRETDHLSSTLANQPVQKHTITGTVTDENGDPIIGANIVETGSRNGTVTDINGNFTMELTKKNALIRITYIGYQSQELSVVSGSKQLIVMKDDAEMLAEVIVTGYGTFKKSSYTGSATTVGMSSKENVPTTDFKTLIQGSAPGVQVNAGSGAVGGSSNITIRGMGSINASTSPLYVIDGVPVMSAISSGIDGGTDFMATLNASDIENVTVIKDAAAASLYGSRAANGVILITTRSGKSGKQVFQLKVDGGYSGYATDFFETMSGPERREVLHEGLVNQGIYMKDLSKEDAVKYADENIDKYAPVPWSGWEDWESALFRSRAPYRNYDFSASGGDSKISYYSSLAYTDQKGIVRQQDFNRITGRLNVSYKMTERLQLGARILFSSMTQNGSSEGGTYTSPIYSTRHKVSASDPIFDQNGDYNKELLANGHRNPKSQLDLNYKRQTVKRSFNTAFANYTLWDGLVFNTTYSLDHGLGNYKSWSDPRSTDGEKDNGSLSEDMYEYNQMVWKNNLSYVKTWNDIHHLDALAGYETHEYKRHYLSNTVKDFPNVEKHEIGNGAQNTAFGGNSTGWRLLSYLGRVNYDFNNKYYFSGSVRTDASSRFHKDSRWGVFWALSAAWRISAEPFMKPLENFLTDAKIRFSYGSNGTQPSSFFGYMDLVGFGYNYNMSPGILETQIGDKMLKWEKSYNMDLGLEARLWDRVNLTVDLYEKKSSDLLMPLPISKTVGFGSILTNIGELKNRGIEIELNADVIRNRDFNWNSGINLSHNQNRLVKLSDQDQITGSYTIHKVGYPYRMFYVKEFAGINPDNGFPQYYVNDPEGDRTITEDHTKANYVMFRGPDPKLIGGWNNTLKYKLLDFSFLWTFTCGGYSYDRAASKLEHAGKETAHNLQTLYRNRWQKPGDKTDIEMVMVGNGYDMSSVVNSRRIHSTDHLRLKNVTVGFSLPKKWIRKMRLDQLRAYFSAVNLLTFAAYDRYDPEVSSDGDVYFEAPKMKTLTFGIDVKF